MNESFTNDNKIYFKIELLQVLENQNSVSLRNSDVGYRESLDYARSESSQFCNKKVTNKKDLVFVFCIENEENKSETSTIHLYACLSGCGLCFTSFR